MLVLLHASKYGRQVIAVMGSITIAPNLRCSCSLQQAVKNTHTIKNEEDHERHCCCSSLYEVESDGTRKRCTLQSKVAHRLVFGRGVLARHRGHCRFRGERDGNRCDGLHAKNGRNTSHYVSAKATSESTTKQNGQDGKKTNRRHSGRWCG